MSERQPIRDGQGDSEASLGAAFYPGKEAWKAKPGNRYTPAALLAMERHWKVKIQPSGAPHRYSEVDPMTAKPSENGVDWEAAKRCLAQIQRDAPAILQQGVIIGGIACWFYRNLLTRAQDPAFPAPVFSPAEEAVWLSKDIDFTNFFAPDARNLLSQHIISDSDGRLHLNVAGVPIGFAQVGVTFDPEQAWTDSWIAAFESDGTSIECRILDPISLYREKLALSQRRGVESDRLHCALLIEFLRYEVCRQADALAAAANLEGRTAAAKFLFAIRDRATEVFDDARVSSRFQSILAASRTLSPSERSLLSEAVTRHS